MAELIYDPQAKVEIREAAEYYEDCRENLGQDFLRAVEVATHSISLNPLRWRKISGQFRLCLVERFPYGVIYSVEKGKIFIAAVMHLKRKPGYWKKRLEKR
ncbi:MAG: type II toxin-antitoxin system RelE/ParE family toxin [bacterium]|nr:type II toxin-antitoxin system RelE/ParE family toxin [bacterium]